MILAALWERFSTIRGISSTSIVLTSLEHTRWTGESFYNRNLNKLNSVNRKTKKNVLVSRTLYNSGVLTRKCFLQFDISYKK